MSRQQILFFFALTLLGVFPILFASNRNIESLRILQGAQNYPTPSSDLEEHRLTIYQFLSDEIYKGKIDQSNDKLKIALNLHYPLITSLYGWLLVNEGDYYGGLDIWYKLGDLISILDAGETAEERDQFQEALFAYQLAHQLAPWR
jgi:hypothetical protein